jgi:hypothetical protein
MRPKVTLSTAWAEKLGFSDEEICKLFDIDPASAVPTDETVRFGCPKCGNSEDDSDFIFYSYAPSDLPTSYSGRQYVGCVCGTTYVLGFRAEQHFVLEK